MNTTELTTLTLRQPNKHKRFINNNNTNDMQGMMWGETDLRKALSDLSILLTLADHDSHIHNGTCPVNITCNTSFYIHVECK